MKKMALVAALVITAAAHAQERIVPLVEAERSFARYALEHNTREAFLKFMDSAAVVFDKGEIQNAKLTWEAKKPSAGKLIWEPAFAVISTAGDLGVTTGPWEFRASASDTAIASGVFTSVWKKNAAGEWKWLVDMGVEHNQKGPAFKDVVSIELNHIERSSYDALRYMLNAEQQFINTYGSTGKEAWTAVADNDVYLINPGQLPIQGKNRINEALVNMSGGIKFQAIGSGVSKDGDLGYVYGYANEEGKKGNYLRIWRRVGRKWTLLLQTLTV